MNKEIKINPDLFNPKSKSKTLKKKTMTGVEIKKALLETMNTDPILTAINELELIQKRIPFIIRRPIPGGSCEYWNLKDLEIICF